MHGLGLMACQAGNFAEAENLLRQALASHPDDPALHNNLNLALRQLGRPAEAIACCRRAIELAPHLPQLHNNLGVALKETGAWAEAEQSFDRALALQPGYADAHYNLANTLVEAGRLDEAERSFRRAIELAPRDWQAHNNLGNLLKLWGRHGEALAQFDAALGCNPQAAEAHRNRALLKLLLGDFAAGWPEYEWRKRLPGYGGTQYAQPEWQGEPLAGKTLRICAEQGLGDVIQMVRYAPLLAEYDARVHLECPPTLHALLTGAPGIDKLVARGDGEPFDAYVPMFSLPTILGTTLETLPGGVPYLAAEEQRAATWRPELAAEQALKIGIAWQGNRDFAGDAYRSVPLSEFEPLARVPGAKLFSLQKGPGSEQLPPLAQRLHIVDLAPRLDNDGHAFVDTAAVMRSLDLVVTSDTAIAHVAGALGVPVWLALQYSPNWRWLLERADCPWYPTMRLFRQRHFGAWSDVFADIAAALASLDR